MIQDFDQSNRGTAYIINNFNFFEKNECVRQYKKNESENGVSDNLSCSYLKFIRMHQMKAEACLIEFLVLLTLSLSGSN